MGFNLTDALKALENSNSQASSIVELRGERGEVGPPGVDGKDGKDAPPVSIRIGTVVATDGEPAARIRATGDNSFVLDLALPKGPVGPRGPLGLQSEEPGPVGPKGDSPSEEELLRLIRRVVQENRQALTGPRGERGAEGERGPQGVMGLKGDTGEQGPMGEATIVSEDDLKEIFVRVLSDSGVLSEAQARLIAVRAELRRALHSVSSRSIAELQTVYRNVDNIIG